MDKLNENENSEVKLPKPLEYAGTGKPIYAMDVILAKQETYKKEKENVK